MTILRAAAAAQTPDATTTRTSRLAVTGAATLATDYRLRGLSQSDGHPAVQGTLILTHDSGVYAGVWASDLAGWGKFGGANMELDLIGGYRAKPADYAALDGALTWYMYPGGAAKTRSANGMSPAPTPRRAPASRRSRGARGDERAGRAWPRPWLRCGAARPRPPHRGARGERGPPNPQGA